MATQLYKPRIALVANSIVFQRENRLISLDTLTMQVRGMHVSRVKLAAKTFTRGEF